MSMRRILSMFDLFPAIPSIFIFSPLVTDSILITVITSDFSSIDHFSVWVRFLFSPSLLFASRSRGVAFWCLLPSISFCLYLSLPIYLSLLSPYTRTLTHIQSFHIVIFSRNKNMVMTYNNCMDFFSVVRKKGRWERDGERLREKEHAWMHMNVRPHTLRAWASAWNIRRLFWPSRTNEDFVLV